MSPEYPRYRKWPYLVCFIASLVLTSCGRKQPDSSRMQPPTTQTPNAPATPGPAAPTVQISVMAITYQTQTTPNSSIPPTMRAGPTQGQEIRYLDFTNNRMRLEKYVFSGAGRKLYQTMIIDQSGSYRLEPGKNEAVFTKMTKPVPAWNFDDNVNVAWAREHGLTVQPGEWLGRKCDVIGLGGSGKVWLWNDIPLKKEQKVIGRDITIQASRIQENTSIDAALLELPKGMTVR